MDSRTASRVSHWTAPALTLRRHAQANIEVRYILARGERHICMFASRNVDACAAPPLPSMRTHKLEIAASWPLRPRSCLCARALWCALCSACSYEELFFDYNYTSESHILAAPKVARSQRPLPCATARRPLPAATASGACQPLPRLRYNGGIQNCVDSAVDHACAGRQGQEFAEGTRTRGRQEVTGRGHRCGRERRRHWCAGQVDTRGGGGDNGQAPAQVRARKYRRREFVAPWLCTAKRPPRNLVPHTRVPTPHSPRYSPPHSPIIRFPHLHFPGFHSVCALSIHTCAACANGWSV